jgi:pilus assembly protein CpaF
MFAIVVSEKGGESKRLEFDKAEVTIGRVQGNDIILPKGNVSKRHSRIVLKDGKFIIVDLKSTNGTYVNGRKITSPLVVKSSDKIYIGDFILNLEEAADAQATASGDVEEPPPPPPPPPRKLPTMPPPPPRRADPEPAFSESGTGTSSGDDDEVSEPEEKVEPVRPRSTVPSVRREEEPTPPPVRAPVPDRPSRPAVEAPPPRQPSISTPAVSGANLRRAVDHGRRPLADAKRAKVSQIMRDLGQKLLAHLNLDGSTPVDDVTMSRAESTTAKWVEDVELPVGVEPTDLAKEIVDETLGLGPLGELQDDPSVQEVVVARPDRIFVVREGQAAPHHKWFSSALALERVMMRILGKHGRHVSGPSVDARLDSGMILSGTLHGVAGPAITLRRPRPAAAGVSDLVQQGVLSNEMAEFLNLAAQGHRNIVVSGPSGSGRTMMVGALGRAGRPGERVVSVEDSEELDLGEGTWIPLLTKGHPSEVLSHGLRMRAERILVGDLRGGETLVLLQALSAGPIGAVAAIQATSGRDALGRLEALARTGEGHPSAEAVRELVAQGVHLVVQMGRDASGEPRVFEVAEVVQKGGAPSLVPVFSFKAETGRFSSSGHMPQWADAGAGMAMRR